MINLIKVDIQNCINSVRFKVAFITLFSLAMINTLFSFYNSYNKISTQISITRFQGILLGSNAGGRSIFGLFIAITPLVVVSIFSDSFYKDRKSGAHISIFQRAGKRRYILSKLIVCGLISAITVGGCLLLNEIISFIVFNKAGSYSNGLMAYDTSFSESIPLLGTFFNNNIILGKIVLILINCIYAMIISMITFITSFFLNVKNYTLLIGAFIIDYLIEILIPINLYKYFSLTLIRQGGGHSILSFISIIIIWSLIIFILTKLSLKKDLF